MKCSGKIDKRKIQHFTKATKTISTKCNPVSTSLRPVGDSFMFVEISGKIQVMETISLVLKEQIVFKLVKENLTSTVFLQEITKQCKNSQFKKQLKANGTLEK